ncbi:hypothetical protein CGI90_24455 [Vibrio parahaemolyticus]|nr:hypothetical protein CGI90_24455 [Vibrio parahaemolyticus]
MGFSTRGIFGMRLILGLKCHAAAKSLRASPLNWALCARRQNDQSVLIRLGRYANDRFPRSNRENV